MTLRKIMHNYLIFLLYFEPERSELRRIGKIQISNKKYASF